MKELEGLDRTIERGMARAKTPGLSVGLIRPGQPPFAKGYGYRDREAKLPATPRTVYGIASVTKSFTALAILRLAEHGRLRVTDPVVRHLPELRIPGASARHPIRLHHFLTHSSGLPPLPSIYYTSMRSVRRDPPYDPRVARRVGVDPDHEPLDTYEQLMRYLSEEKYRLLGRPGQFFSYSNEAFGLLGAVIERASGQRYERFLEDEILRPAGMTSAVFDPGVLFRQPEVTTLYSPRWTGKRHSLAPSQEWWEDACLRGAGALRTNVVDLLQYLQIFLHRGRVGREQVVSASSVAAMMRPHVPVGMGVHYGYGVAVRPDYHGTLLVSHSGGLKGVSSLFAAAPRRGVAGVILSNAEGAPVSRLLGAAVNPALGLPAKTPFEEIPKVSGVAVPLSPYSGWYCSGEGIWAEIRPRKDHLRLDFRGIEVIAKDLKMFPAGHDQFVVRHQGQSAVFRFSRDDSGRVDSIFLGWRLLQRRKASELGRAARGTMVW
ncbi:MAG: serine hydrolase domain-containing protein [Thermoplasmata archaeon]|nr:serine hydrolase domain-containing protein [Thermoplasmata archaeon]